MMTTEQWRAIQTNDATADGQFFYGVTSTGIFCRPSCHSRVPRHEHVQLFPTATAAMAAGFRPCKRCRPAGLAVTSASWVATIDDLIKTHYAEPLPLAKLAQLAHGVPSYLQHVYRAETGQTPLTTLKQVRLQQAQLLLLTTTLSSKVIAQKCGFQSSAYFSTCFKQQFGQTPRQYRLTLQSN